MECLVSYGYPTLFAVSFLAATVAPLGSEWLLAALLVKGLDPAILLFAATSGNVLGAQTTWAIGIWGGPFLMERVLGIGKASRQKAQRLYDRWGSWSLLMAWAPVVGDPLCLVGGLFGVPFWRFTLFVGAGKLARYAFLIYVVAQVSGR